MPFNAQYEEQRGSMHNNHTSNINNTNTSSSNLNTSGSIGVGNGNSSSSSSDASIISGNSIGRSNDLKTVALLDQIFSVALAVAASDIHIEPRQDLGMVRFRIDGVLTTYQPLPNLVIKQIISRLKVLANLDITETRLPQDGSIKLGATLQHTEVRLSTCPTIFGEKIALRLLKTTALVMDLAATGLEVGQQQVLRHYINKPQGLVLITGPTGSGKTTLLYAILSAINANKLNILTIEDPVEVVLPNINQISLNAKIGVNFATILKTVLRQDPNVIMIGEIRDTETAQIAIKAAQTGHLVLATLHTASALSAIARLKLLGVAQQDVLETVNLIVNQRLVRKLCAICKPGTDANTNHRIACAACVDGYQGRTGVFELLTKSQLRNFYTRNVARLRAAQSPTSLRVAILTKVQHGVTSMAELKRVL
jgi:type IV pilus assembly protein PilB